MARKRRSLMENLEKLDMDFLFYLYGVTTWEFASFCRKHPSQISTWKSAEKKPGWFLREQAKFIKMISNHVEAKDNDPREVKEYIDALLNLTDYILIKNKEAKKFHVMSRVA